MTSFSERGSPIPLHNGLVITDADDVHLCNAVVTVANPLDGSAEKLIDNAIGDPLMSIVITDHSIQLIAMTPLPIANFESILRMVCRDYSVS